MLKEIRELCERFLAEECDEAEFTRRLAALINAGDAHVEVAECLKNYLR